MVGENTASARAPAITAHEPLDTSPSLENHAGHRLRHRRPPPVRGREEVLRRQEGTRRDARESGKRHRDSAVLFRPRRKNPASRLPARHAAATDRRPIPPSRSRSAGCRRQARCARQGGLVHRLPREHGAFRDDASSRPRSVRSEALNRSRDKRDFSATRRSSGTAHADRDRADREPRASGDDPARQPRRASLTFPVHARSLLSRSTDRVHQHRGVPFRGPLRPRAHREQELRRRRFVRQDGRGGAPPRAVARPRRFHHRRCRRLGLPRAHHLRGRDPRPEGGGLLLSLRREGRRISFLTRSEEMTDDDECEHECVRGAIATRSATGGFRRRGVRE